MLLDSRSGEEKKSNICNDFDKLQKNFVKVSNIFIQAAKLFSTLLVCMKKNRDSPNIETGLMVQSDDVSFLLNCNF